MDTEKTLKRYQEKYPVGTAIRVKTLVKSYGISTGKPIKGKVTGYETEGYLVRIQYKALESQKLSGKVKGKKYATLNWNIKK